MASRVDLGRYTPFATVPLEIAVEIMKLLDWRSILSIRQTCNLLNGISRVHAVWKSQYHQYMAQRIQSTRLEEPLDSYSVPELERWVLMRRSADVGWKCEDMKFTRNIWISQENVGCTCLVPGGRWLLVGGEDGAMTTYDLDSPTMTRRMLITRDDRDEPLPIHRIVIDIDPPKQSPILTFTMALQASTFTTSPHNTEFWRVTLSGHSTEAQLRAHHLCSIEGGDPGFIRGMAIRRNLFARIHILYRRSYIEVYDWEKSISSPHCKAVIFLDVLIHTIQLLPGDRLLVFSREHTMIYNFATLEGVKVNPGTFVPHITEPHWKLPFAAMRTDRPILSQVFSNDTATYFLVKGRNIYALIVPHDEHQTPHFELLMVLDEWVLCAFGVEKAFAQHKDQSITYLKFSWEEGEAKKVDSSPASTHNGIFLRGYHAPQLDEETGRIVQDLRDGLRIVDTATLYMDSGELEGNSS